MGRDNFAAVILSAGYSSRMKEFKPLLKFGEYTAVEMAINTFKSARINNIIVVVGHRREEVIKVLKDSEVRCIENKNFSRGMYSSVLKALEAIPNYINAFFMLPVDIPLVKKQTIEILKDKYLQSNKGIIYPTFNNKSGHPPLIDCKYKNIIMNCNEEGGLRNILNKFSEDSINVPVFDKSIVMDMDVKADYIRLLQYSKQRLPNREECYCILSKYNVPNNIVKHCIKVSYVALEILKRLNENGYNFDENTIEAAALLHDIARRSEGHAKVGKEILTNLGYEYIGNIISTHMDIEVDENEDITENEILFLADKLVKEDKFVSLESRFSNCLLNEDFEVSGMVKQRFSEAKKIMKKLENLIGKKFNYE